MPADITINDKDIETLYGLCMEEGALNIFQVPPTPKEAFYYEWGDRSGRDYDENAAVLYQVQTFEVPFLMVADDMSDYNTKKKEFLELINTNKEFVLRLEQTSQAFKLRYKGSTNWEFVNYDPSRPISCKVTIKFENNHNPVDPVQTIQVLGDNKGRVIVVNGKVLSIKI